MNDATLVSSLLTLKFHSLFGVFNVNYELVNTEWVTELPTVMSNSFLIHDAVTVTTEHIK